VVTQEPVFLYCLDVDVIKSDRPAPINLGTIHIGDIVIGCYVNKHSPPTPVRQLFVAIVCCKCPKNPNNVVVRFQSSSDHLYEFSGGFFSIRAGRLVSPYNCVLQHLSGTTVCGIPGLNNHLGFISDVNNYQIQIGDFFQFLNKDRSLSCLCLIVGFVFDDTNWNIVVVVDPTPSGAIDNGWRSRLCIIQSSSLKYEIQTGCVVTWRQLPLNPMTKRLITEVIHNTHETIGIHARQGAVITNDVKQILNYRIAQVKQNKDATSTIHGGPVKWPVTSSKSDVHVVFSHAGRLIMDINS
jgi:hypothetical protein